MPLPEKFWLPGRPRDPGSQQNDDFLIKELVKTNTALNLHSEGTVTTLPSSPDDGQEVYLQTTAMAAVGAIWHLRYRAAGGTHKWECIGGNWMTGLSGSATVGPVGGGFLYLPNLFTIPRTGIYEYEAGAVLAPNAAAKIALGIDLGTATAFFGVSYDSFDAGTGARISGAFKPVTSTATAAWQVRPFLTAPGYGPNVSYSDVWISIRPQRLS